MIETRILKKSDCMGCTACQAICPTKCISMQSDSNGFKYPKVEQKLCINCSQCLKVCPMDQKLTTNVIETYACANKDDEIRKQSSSGGLFNVLAKYIIEDKNGVVFGASFDSDLNLKHIKIDNVDEIQMLMGSKYLNSDLGETFREIKALLNSGQFVLFTGLPCQAAGLKTYLRREYDNLLIMDVVCHGVPSSGVFKKHTKELKRKHGNIATYEFRAKPNGWYGYETKIVFENGYQLSRNHWKDPYMVLFLKNMILMDACYSCKFKGSSKASDIYVGDYWRGEKLHEKFNDDKGTSVVMLNTTKGSKAFAAIKEQLNYEVTSINHVEKYNSAVVKPVLRPKMQRIVLRSVETIGVNKTSRILTLIDKVIFTFKHPIKAIKLIIK